jgi:hypothetical protein
MPTAFKTNLFLYFLLTCQSYGFEQLILKYIKRTTPFCIIFFFIILKIILTMKHSLLTTLCLLAFSLSANAQITIQSTDLALSVTAKDSAMGKLLKKTGAILPALGNNQTWDYSAFQDSLPNQYYFGVISQPATARPTAFAAANLEADGFYNVPPFSIPARVYYLNNTAGYGNIGDSLLFARFSLLGITGNAADSITYPAQSRVLSNIIYTNKFPMTDKSSWASTNKYTTTFLLKIAALGLNNVAGQNVHTTTKKDTISGWGTLRLRNPANGTALNFNVLLRFTSTTSVDSFFLGGQPAPVNLMNAFGLTQGKRDTSNTFTLMGLNSKGIHLRFVVNNSVTSITNMFRAILPTQGLVLENKDLTDISVKSTVYPNPTTEGVNFEFQKTSAPDWNVMIYNEAGQIVSVNRVNAPQGNVNQRITLASSLPSGTYFYNLLDETSLIRANGKFLLNH